MKITKNALMAAVCLLVFSVLAPSAIAAENAIAKDSSPIILESAMIQEGSQKQIMIKGLISPGNQVLIYFDGFYNGIANISQVNDAFSSFYYLSPFLDGQSIKEIFAISQNLETMALSAPAQSFINSVTEKYPSSWPVQNETIRPAAVPVPAPKLISPKQKNCENQTNFSGFSKNQTFVRLFIDNKFYTGFWVEGNDSDNVFFSRESGSDIGPGWHFIYAMAEDKNGNASGKSNNLDFCLTAPLAASTSTIIDATNENTASSTAGATNDTPVFQKTNQETAATGNSKLNLFLFGLFALIIIVWMFLVNGELSREKHDQPEQK